MLPVEFKKMPCRPVDFKGQGPYKKTHRGVHYVWVLASQTSPPGPLTVIPVHHTKAWSPGTAARRTHVMGQTRGSGHR